MQDGGERVEFVETWHHIAIFDIGGPADVKDKVGAAAFDGDFVAGLFDIAIGKSHVLPNLA